MGQSLHLTGCPYCEKVKRYLASKGVDFTAYDIEQDAAAREACKKLTGMDYAVPVTTIDDENFVIDFDKQALDDLLCL